MPPNELRLDDLGQIAITVRDLDAAVQFYRDTLGVPFLFAAPPALAFFGLGSVRLMLTTPESPEFDHPASVLYFRVDDIEATHRTLADRSVSFEKPPHVLHRTADTELWMAFFRDPENHLLALMSEVPAA